MAKKYTFHYIHGDKKEELLLGIGNTRDMDHRYALAFESAPLGVGLLSLEGKFLHANEAYCEMLGYSLDELVAIDFQTITHPDDLKRDEDFVSQCVAGSIDRYNMEKRYIRKDGSEIWVHLYVSLIRSDTRGPYFVAHALNITEEMKRRETLRRTEERLMLAVESAEQGFWEWDIKTNQFFISSIFLRLLGRPGTETTTTFSTFLSKIHEQDKKRFIKTVQVHLEENKPFHVEFRIMTEDRGYVWFRAKGRAIWENGEALRMVGFLQDITLERAHEASLVSALAEIQKKNDELEQFAYIASHDLQEPLRTVASYVQLFSVKYKSQVDEKGQQYIDYIVDGTTRMRQLIRDLLDYSRSGNAAPMKETSFHSVMDDVLLSLKGKIAQSKTKISYDHLTDSVLYGSHNDIVRIFVNIISNSIKFRKPDKKCHIRISQNKTEDGYTTFCIRDNGVGINEANFGSLFKMFYRIREGETSKTEGNGIGLAIVKRIIDKHHGKIWVESELDKGTTFYFTLPHTQPEKD